MITPEVLRQRLSPEFGEFDRLTDAILQCTRSFKGTTFAVCFFDGSGDLPETPSALTAYQDAVIGPQFFRLRESLQWSIYLYFVISADRLGDPDTVAVRSMIERDRSYARKRVITDSEITELFGVVPTTSEASSNGENIVDVWTRTLAEAGIERAVLSEEDLPARLARIENTEQRPVKRGFRKDTARRRFEPFVRRLELKDYREFPQQRQFDFGSFNLIFGPNGSGKTSLLEALEAFYCGRMQRNPDLRPEYDLRATLANGEVEHANHRRKPEFFRERSLAWYGRPEIKTRDLYRSFAQFNFLSTDAAVGIAEATEHLEEDLARLLIGPDASKIWRSIERVLEAVEQRLRDCRQLKKLHDDELKSLIAMSESRAEDRASPGLAARLKSVFAANGWEMVSDLSIGNLEGLVHDLAETASVAEQATGLDWRGEPASRDGVARYIVHAQSVIASVDRLMRDHEHDGAILATEDASLRREEEALALAKQLVEFVKADVTAKVDACAAQDRLVRQLRGVLADLGAVDLTILANGERDTTVSAAINALERERNGANEMLLDVRRRQNEVGPTREGLDRLARELRGIASRILASVDDVHECPLCHTSFSRPELQARMNRGIADERLERLSQDLATRATQGEAAIAAIDVRLKTLICLRRYCERVGLGPDSVISEALDSVASSELALESATAQLEEMRAELESLREEGLTVEALADVIRRLREAGYPGDVHTHEGAALLIERIGERIKERSAARDVAARRSDIRRFTITSNLDGLGSALDSPKEVVAQTRERLALALSLNAKLASVQQRFPWPSLRPLVELASEARTVRAQAVDLLETIRSEQRMASNIDDARARCADVEARLRQTESRIRRLAEAQGALRLLTKRHSLTHAMSAALAEHRGKIEQIFVRIHSPAEFRGLGSTIATLRRRAGGTETRLTEISTGQRAAFALSIFLAQNTQMHGGPAVLLVDDPVAHVDDLNCLSFLDYLREIVIALKRQVFFATADARLSALVERKFDFLGEEFKKIVLHRAPEGR